MKPPVVLATALAIAVALPATALAGSRQFNGTAEAGTNAGVEFGTKTTHGKPVRVMRFGWFNILAPCAGSAPTASSDKLTKLKMKVNSHRRFSGKATLSSGNAKATIKGRFTKSFGKATGTLRIKGSMPGCGKADTGTVKWTAKAVGH